MNWRGLFSFTRWTFSKIIFHEDKSKLHKNFFVRSNSIWPGLQTKADSRKCYFFCQKQHEKFWAQNSHLNRKKKTFKCGKDSVSRPWKNFIGNAITLCVASLYFKAGNIISAKKFESGSETFLRVLFDLIFVKRKLKFHLENFLKYKGKLVISLKFLHEVMFRNFW